MPEGNRVTIDKVYELLDDRSKQTNDQLRAVEGKIDRLEGGRIVNIEQRLSAQEQKTATIDGKMLMVPILISIAIGVFGFIVNRVL